MSIINQYKFGVSFTIFIFCFVLFFIIYGVYHCDYEDCEKNISCIRKLEILKTVTMTISVLSFIYSIKCAIEYNHGSQTNSDYNTGSTYILSEGV